MRINKSFADLCLMCQVSIMELEEIKLGFMFRLENGNLGTVYHGNEDYIIFIDNVNETYAVCPFHLLRLTVDPFGKLHGIDIDLDYTDEYTEEFLKLVREGVESEKYEMFSPIKYKNIQWFKKDNNCYVVIVPALNKMMSAYLENLPSDIRSIISEYENG